MIANYYLSLINRDSNFRVYSHRQGSVLNYSFAGYCDYRDLLFGVAVHTDPFFRNMKTTGKDLKFSHIFRKK